LMIWGLGFIEKVQDLSSVSGVQCFGLIGDWEG
jgi:hypothetical protein